LHHVLGEEFFMTTQYQRGRRFEWKVKQDLEGRGYYVIRSAGSKSKVDLVGIKHEVVLCVQCKLTGAIAKRELREFTNACHTNPHIVPVVAQGTKEGRRAVIQYWDAETGDDFDPGEKEE